MGGKLVQYYDFATKNGGLATRMQLAMKTGIPSDKAQDAPDSPENLAKFHAALKELVGANAPQF